MIPMFRSSSSQGASKTHPKSRETYPHPERMKNPNKQTKFHIKIISNLPENTI